MILKWHLPMLPAPIIWKSLHVSPRSKGGQIGLGKAKRDLRHYSRLYCQKALLQGAGDHKRVSPEYPTPKFPGGLLHMRFVWSKRSEFRDANNCIAASKSLIDGLQDAGLIQDDTTLQIGKVERETIKTRAENELGVYLIYESDPAPVRSVPARPDAKRCETCGQVRR